MKRAIHFNQSGFTLIELLTVITIVGVLAVGLMTILNPLEQLAKSRDARRKSDLSAIQKALELYYNDYGVYPTSTNGLIVGSTGTGVPWGEPPGFPPYMQLLPKDPTATKQYSYVSTGQSYRIFASLDRKSDPNLCTPGDVTGVCASATAGGANCKGACNYAVSSPNVSANTP